MGRVTKASACSRRQGWHGVAALAACTLLGACAQTGKPSLTNLISQNQAATQAADAHVTAENKSELAKATEYWSKEYAKEPRNLETALNLARDLKAMGEKKRALVVLQQASLLHGNSRKLASEYGRLALEFDQVSLANRLLAIADDPADPDWRVVDARGTVLAKQGKYKDAIPFYERALTLAPDRPSVLSNLALAHAMNGDPKRAEALLRQAAATDRNSLKIRQNLALVLGLEGKYDEAKLLASRDLPAESAAEDTDYLRRIVKLEPKDAPPAGAPRQVAKAQPIPPLPKAKARSGGVADAQVEPLRTSLKRAKEPVVAALRGSVVPASVAAASPATAQEEPGTPPDIAATFSVAQWMPATEPATDKKAPRAPASK